jgi:hypothetical protein
VALEAERADIRQIAFAAALGYRRDVVGIPQACAPQILESPIAK